MSQKTTSFYIMENGLQLKNFSGEEWKPLKDSNQKYWISNYGRLKSCMMKLEKIMKPAINRKGYLHTMIVINGKNQQIKLHRLVGEYFVPNPEGKPQINHKDCNKRNNHASNLEWVTNKENFHHARENGLMSGFMEQSGRFENLQHLQGEEIATSKLTKKEVQEIRQKFKPRKYTREMLGREYNVKPATIKDIVLRKSWKHVK